MAARDVLMVAVVLFVFSLGFFIIFFAANTTVDTMLGISQINQSAGAVESLEGAKTVTERLDYVIFVLFIALVLGVIITGWFVGGNPIFVFAYILVVVVATAISAVFSNVWETVSTLAQFGLTVTSFPIANHLLLNLPYYIAVVGFIGMIVMFMKPYVSAR